MKFIQHKRLDSKRGVALQIETLSTTPLLSTRPYSAINYLAVILFYASVTRANYEVTFTESL